MAMHIDLVTICILRFTSVRVSTFKTEYGHNIIDLQRTYGLFALWTPCKLEILIDIK